MQRLTAFISSTVKDFGPTRSDLRAWLHQQQMDVRTSESPDFPVDDGVTSHDACLRAIEGCNVVIVLIGRRYGGGYAGTPKSITRREYEEAVERRIPTIVLILGEVTADAERWKGGRGELKAPPFGKDTDALVDFLDLVRKGHRDNWIHPTWDGSLGQAKTIVRARMNALFVRYQGPHQEIRARAERLALYAKARGECDHLVQFLARARGPAKANVETLLEALAKNREVLLGYGTNTRWNFAVYRRRGRSRQLDVYARAAHADVPITNRSWAIGAGHVGLAWESGQALAAPDLTVTPSWAGSRPGDADSYRSAVAVPIYDARNTVTAVFVATSNRLDHFRDPEQLEVVTADAVSFWVSLLILGGLQ